MHKDNLAAYEIISEMPLFFHQKQIPTLFKKEKKEFDVIDELESVEHTPLYKVHTMTLRRITLCWKNFYQQSANMCMKFLHEV